MITNVTPSPFTISPFLQLITSITAKYKLFLFWINPNSPKSSNLNTILHTP